MIESRDQLEQRYDELERALAGGHRRAAARRSGAVTVLAPLTFEFWHGRANRMHDRLRYRRSAERRANGWVIERLAP